MYVARCAPQGEWRRPAVKDRLLPKRLMNPPFPARGLHRQLNASATSLPSRAFYGVCLPEKRESKLGPSCYCMHIDKYLGT